MKEKYTSARSNRSKDMDGVFRYKNPVRSIKDSFLAIRKKDKELRSTIMVICMLGIFSITKNMEREFFIGLI